MAVFFMVKNLWWKNTYANWSGLLNYKCNKDVKRYIGGRIKWPTLVSVEITNLIHSGVEPSGKAPRSSWTTLYTSFYRKNPSDKKRPSRLDIYTIMCYYIRYD